MRAGHAALISAALTALVLIALLPHVAPSTPYLPKVTTTQTITQTLTTTAWRTTTQTTVSTATLTRIITNTPPTTTLTTTEVRTTTKTLTKTQTITKTETITTTTTVTITEVENTFQYLRSSDKAIRLIAHANKTLIIYIPYPLLGDLPRKFPPTLGKILNTTLQLYEQRKVDAYVVVAYDPVCKIEIKDILIKYLDRLNQTLPPKHVLEAKNEEWFITYPFVRHYLVIAMIDGKYMIFIKSGYIAFTGSYEDTIIAYNPKLVNKTMTLALQAFRNFDNPNSPWYRYPIWVWDGCKSHESPWG